VKRKAEEGMTSPTMQSILGFLIGIRGGCDSLFHAMTRRRVDFRRPDRIQTVNHAEVTRASRRFQQLSTGTLSLNPVFDEVPCRLR
jgi:hypothetical protein